MGRTQTIEEQTRPSTFPARQTPGGQSADMKFVLQKTVTDFPRQGFQQLISFPVRDRGFFLRQPFQIGIDPSDLILGVCDIERFVFQPEVPRRKCRYSLFRSCPEKRIKTTYLKKENCALGCEPSRERETKK